MMKNIFIILLVLVGVNNIIFSQNNQPFEVHTLKAHRIGTTNALSEKPLLNLVPKVGKNKKWKANKPKEIPNFYPDKSKLENIIESAEPKGDDPLRELGFKKNPTDVITTNVNIEGISYLNAYAFPPDTDGDVSPNYYIQAVNSSNGGVFIVKDKQGNTVYGPQDMNVFWQEFNYTGLGDPIVLYDQSAQRWIMTELSDIGTNLMLVAVSVTNDPLGEWFAYEIQAPELPDYPKYGVWNDAIYITTNEISGEQIPTYLINKKELYQGDANVEIQVISGLPKFENTTFQTAAPADWDGTMPPPEGSPLYVLRVYDDAWEGGDDAIEIWQIKVVWGDATATTLEGPISMLVAAFDGDLCDAFNECLEQPNGFKIEDLPNVVMNHCRYRNFGTYECIIMNHSVDVVLVGDYAGIRWYEFRKYPGSNWQIYQQGTYNPDITHRFIGSMAMNGKGDIAIGYSVMGEDDKLSLRVTGRKATDPLGQFTFEENQIATGLSYASTIHRWGDYACMTVDPSDDRTFWFTGEYMRYNDGLSWGTKIAAFNLGKDSLDIAPIALETPKSGAYLTNSETLSFLVKNQGLTEVNSFQVGYIFENQTPIIQTINQSLAPDSSILVTFDETVDMSELKDYQFTLFTNLANDQLVLNDTLRSPISKGARFDIALTKTDGLKNALCSLHPEISVTIKNTGYDTLTNAKINWLVNGEINGSFYWEGSLAQFEKNTFTFTLDSLTYGVNDLVLFTSDPNGQPDQRTSNDTLSQGVFAQDYTVGLTLQLQVDLNPDETTWVIQDNQGYTLFSEGPYPNLYADEDHYKVYNHDICLNPDSCYQFTIFDAGNNGLVDFFDSTGYYKLLDAQGNVKFEMDDPNFGNMKNYEFCADFSCSLVANYSFIPVTEPGLSDGTIILKAENGNPPFQYSIDGGNSFQTNAIFNNLTQGTYNLLITDENNCSATNSVSLDTCTLTVSYEVTPATSPTANNAQVTINYSGGLAPIKFSKNGGLSYFVNSTFINLKDTLYVFCVKDAQGCEICDSIMIGFTNSANDFNHNFDVNISPNPTNGIFKIEVNGYEAETMWVEILDANGKIMRHVRLIKYDDSLVATTSILAYPAGIYYVRFKDNNFHKAFKILKNQ